MSAVASPLAGFSLCRVDRRVTGLIGRMNGSASIREAQSILQHGSDAVDARDGQPGRFHNRPSKRPKSSMKVNTTGITKRLRKVEVISPPITTTAIG